jgi:hypothetical protein
MGFSVNFPSNTVVSIDVGNAYIDNIGDLSDYIGQKITITDINGRKISGYIGEQGLSSLSQRGSILTASDAAASDYFGYSTAISSDGNILVVATGALAAYENISGIYIYDRFGDSWVQRGSVLIPPNIVNDAWGYAVSLSSDGAILAVGVGLKTINFTSQGGVYIYDRFGDSWVQRGSVLTASDAAVSDYFGSSVSLSSDGNILAVGAPYWEGSLTNQGGVYIYDIHFLHH